MRSLQSILFPELILAVVAAVLFLLGASKQTAARKFTPVLALMGLIGALVAALSADFDGTKTFFDASRAVQFNDFTIFVKVTVCTLAALFVLLAWPTNLEATANRSIQFGTETGEFFALLLLSAIGVMIVADANSLATLFLGVELASIPTYIMVTMSRPHEQAQEAGMKYFFLGAAAAAVMALGISYLYGTTGSLQLDTIQEILSKTIVGGLHGELVNGASTLQLLAVVLIIVGFSFKLAAVPLHFYAGDVYQGAATPVTAFISFIPKFTGVIALIKLLETVSGGQWIVPSKISDLLFIISILTMTVGNLLGLMQYNVKRVFAYSSVAHSGYLLVGLTAATLTTHRADRPDALAGVLYYMVGYGLMSVVTFGVLMLLPSKLNQPATTAETYDDLQGTARKHPALGIAMAIACFSLVGLPFTIGFWGKLQLIRPAIQSGNTQLVWLAIITMVNAAISTGYYLKIVITMWTPAASDPHSNALPSEKSFPIYVAVVVATTAILVFGIIIPTTDVLGSIAHDAIAPIIP